MNTIRYEIPKALGFDVYWANPALKEKKDALFQGDDFFARVKYTPELLEKAIEKLEYVNEVFMNTEAYNNLNIVKELSSITTPTLVIQGEYDYAIGTEQGKTIFNALINIPKKDKELIYIKNASHNTPFEAPEVYYGALKVFFKRYN